MEASLGVLVRRGPHTVTPATYRLPASPTYLQPDENQLCEKLQGRSEEEEDIQVAPSGSTFYGRITTAM